MTGGNDADVVIGGTRAAGRDDKADFLFGDNGADIIIGDNGFVDYTAANAFRNYSDPRPADDNTASDIDRSSSSCALVQPPRPEALTVVIVTNRTNTAAAKMRFVITAASITEPG